MGWEAQSWRGRIPERNVAGGALGAFPMLKLLPPKASGMEESLNSFPSLCHRITDVGIRLTWHTFNYKLHESLGRSLGLHRPVLPCMSNSDKLT